VVRHLRGVCVERMRPEVLSSSPGYDLLLADMFLHARSVLLMGCGPWLARAVGLGHRLAPSSCASTRQEAGLLEGLPVLDRGSLRLALGLLRLLLRPLQRHAGAALRHEDVLGALHERISLNDKLIVLVGGHAVLHPVPLP
jgi:hypothetical protein